MKTLKKDKYRLGVENEHLQEAVKQRTPLTIRCEGFILYAIIRIKNSHLFTF